jgi:hypothetical protein
MKLILILAAVFSINAHAALPPGFDLAKYQALIETAGQKGELLHGGGDGMDYKVLSRFAPTDTTKPHQADYFSAVGGVDSQGKWGTAEVSMESEDWRKDEKGNWQIEQWMWTAYTDGTLVSVNHALLSETPDHDVLDDQMLPHGQPADAVELARWGAKVAEWERMSPAVNGTLTRETCDPSKSSKP